MSDGNDRAQTGNAGDPAMGHPTGVHLGIGVGSFGGRSGGGLGIGLGF